MAKSKKQAELENRVDELVADLQRTRADFENYRKRTEAEKAASYQHGQESAITKLLPVIDSIDRAIAHTPDNLKDDKWAQGVVSLSKNIDKLLQGLGVERIEAVIGSEFNPEVHEAIQLDEDSQGDKEVIAEVLQAGYTLNGQSIRSAMVKVSRTKA